MNHLSRVTACNCQIGGLRAGKSWMVTLVERTRRQMDRCRLRIDTPAPFEQVGSGPNDFVDLVSQIAAGEIVTSILLSLACAADFSQSRGDLLQLVLGRPLDAALVGSGGKTNDIVVAMARMHPPRGTVERNHSRFAGD